MKDPPSMPRFTDPAAVPLIEAAMQAVRDHKGLLRWREQRKQIKRSWPIEYETIPPNIPAALQRLLDEKVGENWPIYARFSETHGVVASRGIAHIRGTRRRRELLEHLDHALGAAKGEIRSANHYFAREHGWSDVFLSPAEQRYIEHRRIAEGS